MILIDLNQVMISGLLAHIGPKDKIQEDLIRHVVLNVIRSNVKKFKGEYGDVILCCDNRNYWRKKIFPYYKAHRKQDRAKSPLDWNSIFKTLNIIRDELKTYFPYKVIDVESAEADDVIATLAPRLSISEKVVIISSDKDFVQLQKYPNIKQYNPMLNIFVTSTNPVKDLKEKIIRGDKGDGIPNILSGDSVFVNNVRQAPITSKKLDGWIEQAPKECFTEDVYRNYLRNETLISFDKIPEDIGKAIITEYENCKQATKQTMYKYFLEKKLITLLEVIDEF